MIPACVGTTIWEFLERICRNNLDFSRQPPGTIVVILSDRLNFPEKREIRIATICPIVYNAPESGSNPAYLVPFDSTLYTQIHG